MLKFFSIIILSNCFSYSQVAKARFIKEVDCGQQYIIWNGYVIDSTYWNVWLPNGDLPRRKDGTYLYWKQDQYGKLIPLKKIDYRLPIFNDEPATYIINKEDMIFNTDPNKEFK